MSDPTEDWKVAREKATLAEHTAKRSETRTVALGLCLGFTFLVYMAWEIGRTHRFEDCANSKGVNVVDCKEAAAP